MNWDDDSLCRGYLVKFCPHDLFARTPSDIGKCNKHHDPSLKESFDRCPTRDSYAPRFEAELASFCENLVAELDKRITRGYERLAKEFTMLDLEKKDGTLSVQDDLVKLTREKEMKLCETCGAFLISDVALERDRPHVSTKQHVGYLMVRGFVTEFKEQASEEERLAKEKALAVLKNTRHTSTSGSGYGTNKWPRYDTGRAPDCKNNKEKYTWHRA